MSLTAKNYGALFARNFSQQANGGDGREVRLFRCLRKAILSTGPHFPVEEFHGNRAQVVFPASPPWTKTVARCELSDLCIVWFRVHPQPSARITFLQAKRSHLSYNLCGQGCGGRINEHFGGDSTQWYLLNRRPPLVGRFQTFQPPPNLLKDALLPSVASYCVFHETSPQEYSFFYASADVISASKPSKPGHVQLTACSPVMDVNNSGLDEQKWTCCPLIFGHALYSGKIGTPIDYMNIASPKDSVFRASVRLWLASVLTKAVQAQRVGPVIRAFIETLDMPLSEKPTTAPARSIIFVRGDADFHRERQ